MCYKLLVMSRFEMKFNLEQYKKYLKAAGRHEKDGIWDVIRYPNGKYCFATNQKLGDHGKIYEHPMLGKSFKHVKSGKIYVVDSVCIHWDMGYFYHATLRDENNSHVTAIIGNINCEDSLTLSFLEKFNKTYNLI